MMTEEKIGLQKFCEELLIGACFHWSHNIDGFTQVYYEDYPPALRAEVNYDDGLFELFDENNEKIHSSYFSNVYEIAQVFTIRQLK